jgi:hypothetical protein
VSELKFRLKRVQGAPVSHHRVEALSDPDKVVLAAGLAIANEINIADDRLHDFCTVT